MNSPPKAEASTTATPQRGDPGEHGAAAAAEGHAGEPAERADGDRAPAAVSRGRDGVAVASQSGHPRSVGEKRYAS